VRTRPGLEVVAPLRLQFLSALDCEVLVLGVEHDDAAGDIGHPIEHLVDPARVGVVDPEFGEAFLYQLKKIL